MLDINIDDEFLVFKPIQKSEYFKLFCWYNDTEEYKFATGIDKPITFDNLHQKFEEVYVSDHEFLIGICLKLNKKCIGVVRGGLNNKVNNALWINSIIIDKEYQRKGYGTRTVQLLNDYFKNKHNINQTYVSVVNKNLKAKKFWEKLGFNLYRKMKNHLILDNEKQDVIILIKQLNKCKLSS